MSYRRMFAAGLMLSVGPSIIGSTVAVVVTHLVGR